MDIPTISVVIPSYNHEKYVKETIESVLNQTFQDFEIIITDDGSKDNTVNEIKKYSDPRIKLFVFEENQGACKTLNNCINHSKGKYIAVLSSDDVWELDKLEKQLKFLKNHPEIDAVFTKAKIINEFGSSYTDKKHPYYTIFEQTNRSKYEWIRFFFFNGNCLCHPSLLIKKSVYDEVGLYNENLANLPDFDMWTRVCLKLNIYILDEKLVKFRVRDNDANISSLKPTTHIRSRFEAKQILDNYLSINDTSNLLKIFPDAKKYGVIKNKCIPYIIGRIAYDTNVEIKQLWGLELIYNLMKSAKMADILEKEYNFKYSDFLKMSSKADIFKVVTLTEKNKLINDMGRSLTEKNRAIEKKNEIIQQLKKKNKKIKKELLNKINKLSSNIYEIEYKYNRSLSQRFSSQFPSLYLMKNSPGIKVGLTSIKGYNSIKKNNLFDIGYYLKNNPDIRLSGKDPLIHYLHHGYKEGRNPSPKFNNNYYLNTYKDVKKSKINPLIHYSLYGIKEGRKTHKNQVIKKLPKKKKLKDFKPKIAVKITAPNWKTIHHWGDYHFALALKKEFEKSGCDTIIQILPEWYDDIDCDVVLVLRGLKRYIPQKQHFNIIWNISHPDKVSIDEYNQYDYVFIASELWTDKIKDIVNVPVETMLQCTDPEIFYPNSDKKHHELLFVGNSRKVFRKIIKDLIPTSHDLSVYGTHWNGLIDKKYMKGEHIPNKELGKAYSSCKILLNDHWDDMRQKGFISNRLFDGFASGAFIISDNVQCVEKIFGDTLVTYDTPQELHQLVDYYMENAGEREKKSKIAQEIVHKNHTFKNRADRILEVSHLNQTITNYFEVEYSSKKNRITSKISSLSVLLNRKNKSLKNAILNMKGYKAIQKNNLFNTGYYLKNNPDVRLSGKNPLIHYIHYGYKESKNPSLWFDSNYYLNKYKDVKKSNLNPLVHYSLYGKKEGKKGMDDFVSVIMPTYNRKNIIETAIDSVLKQTFTNYELIIIDDESTDGTDKLIKEKYGEYLENGKIKYFKQEKGGVSKARNRGLKESCGNIIAYLDSDNYWFNTFLEKMVRALSNNKNTAYSCIEVDNDHGNKQFVRKRKYNRERLLKGNFIDLNIFVHRKFLYEQLGGFNESLKRLVDWDLILRYTEYHEPYFVNEILAKYFIKTDLNNISISENLKENRLKVNNLHRIELLEKGILSGKKAQMIYENAQESRLKDAQKIKVNPESILNYSDNQISDIENALSPEQKISIIIPFYDCFENAEKCIKAIQENTKIPYELLIVNNNSSKERIIDLRNNVGNIPHLSVQNAKGNTVSAINKFIQNSEGDVVLLSSNTIVTEKWLQKLVLAAYFDKKIGTVIPLSNNLFNFYFSENKKEIEIPSSLTLESMSSLVEKTSLDDNIKFPIINQTAIFIKRELINDIGLLNDELDLWCGVKEDFFMRAFNRSWESIIDDSTYLYHQNNTAISTGKDKKIKSKLEKDFQYNEIVQKINTSPQFNNILENIKFEINNLSFDRINNLNKKRMLLVASQNNAENPNIDLNLLEYLKNTFECFILSSNMKELTLWEYDDSSLKKIKIIQLKSKWSVQNIYNDEFRMFYFNIITGLNIDIIHIKNLFKHTFDLPDISYKLGLPVILSLDDFYLNCPFTNSIDENIDCSEKCNGQVEICQMPHDLINKTPLKEFIEKWREEASNILEKCSIFVTNSRNSKVILSNYPILSSKSWNIIEDYNENKYSNSKPENEKIYYKYECLYLEGLKNNRVYRVALIVRGKDGNFPPTAYIRLLLPFYHPSTYGKISPHIINEDSLKNIDKKSFLNEKTYDCVIVQRDVLNESFAKILVQKCEEQSIRLIYEIDDDLLNIDKTHPEYAKYSSKGKAIEYLIKNADLVTVSTDYLKTKFSSFNNVELIPNALDERIWCTKQDEGIFKDKTIRIGYMGSHTHDSDLILVKKVIENLKKKFAKKNKKISFDIIGGMSEKVNWINPITIPQNKSQYPQFVKWLKKTVNWDIAIAPLADTNINQSKSEIKYLEYTGLGLAVVYSDIGPYHEIIKNENNGLLVQENDPNQWEEQIHKLLHNSELRSKIKNNSRQKIREKYLIKHRTELWLKIIEKLVDY